MSFAPTDTAAASIEAMSSGMSGWRSPLSDGIVCRILMRSRFAPAAFRRGTIVSAGPSSAFKINTLPSIPGAPSGIAQPVDTRAAMSTAIVLLPNPGSPSSTVTLPRGMRVGHTHETRCTVTFEAKIPRVAPSMGAAICPEEYLVTLLAMVAISPSDSGGAHR